LKSCTSISDDFVRVFQALPSDNPTPTQRLSQVRAENLQLFAFDEHEPQFLSSSSSGTKTIEVSDNTPQPEPALTPQELQLDYSLCEQLKHILDDTTE